MFRNVYAIFVFFILAGLSAFAYGQDAQIQGQVLDTTGAAIAKAIIHVSDQQTGTQRNSETNQSGQYTVPGLAPGNYKLIVEASGFGTAISDQIVLNPGQSTVMDFTLKIGPSSADVIVTAEKREERLQDVPIPISVLDADKLADTDQVLLRDYYDSVPGLNLLPGTNEIQSLSIRGITTGIATTTVALMIDGVPYGSSTDLNELPEIDPGDLARIEVLRGPQGTLYGDTSMGGLINFVTKTPTFDGFRARVETGTNFVVNGAEPGYSLRAAANFPLGNKVAIRGSGFERQDPGYVDNPMLSLKGVNKAESYGGRLAMLWLLSPNTSVTLSGLGQYTKADGLPYIEPALGGLRQDYAAGSNYDNRSVQSYSATIKTRLGGVDVTSLTGYNVGVDDNSVDFSEDFGSSAEQLYGVAGSPLYAHFITEKFSEEARLNGSIREKLDWLAGGFYTNEHSPGYQTAFATNPLTGQVVGELGNLEEHGDFQEYAGFANATYHFTNRFDVQLGGRETHTTVSTPVNTYTGIFASVNPSTSSSADVFTYLFTPRFKLTPDVMLYARLASGFRPGAPNTPFVISQGAPAAQTSDTTKDYEVGLKGDFLAHKLSIDTSFYYIDWTNIQIDLANAGANGGGAALFTYGANGGTAKSEGVDFSLTAQPLSGLTLGGWIAYDDAVLTQNFPASSTALGLAGDRLPFAPRFSSNVSADKQFFLASGATAFVGGQVAYVGSRMGTFEPTAQRQNYPDYTKTDLHAGVRYRSWTASAYANNAGDVRGQLNGGIGSFVPRGGFIYTTPRTVGFTVVKTF